MEEITVYYATPWQLLAAAAPYAIKGVGQLLGVGKPKKEDYMPDTSYMDKYIANIRSRQAGRDVYHQAMQPALRTIGAQGRKMQRQVGYGVEKAGLTGSGIEAQQRLSAGKATLGAMQEASEKATAAQISESRRLGEKADAMTLQKEAAMAQGEKSYDRAQTAFKQDVIGNIVGGVGAVAGAGISQYGAGTEAFETAKAAGLTTGTRSEFMEAAKAADYTDPAKYAQSIATEASGKAMTAVLDKDVRAKLQAAGIPASQIAKIGEDKYNIMMKQAAGIMANPNATHEHKEQYLQAIIDMIAGME